MKKGTPESASPSSPKKNRTAGGRAKNEPKVDQPPAKTPRRPLTRSSTISTTTPLSPNKLAARPGTFDDLVASPGSRSHTPERPRPPETTSRKGSSPPSVRGPDPEIVTEIHQPSRDEDSKKKGSSRRKKRGGGEPSDDDSTRSSMPRSLSSPRDTEGSSEPSSLHGSFVRTVPSSKDRDPEAMSLSPRPVRRGGTVEESSPRSFRRGVSNGRERGSQDKDEEVPVSPRTKKTNSGQSASAPDSPKRVIKSQSMHSLSLLSSSGGSPSSPELQTRAATPRTTSLQHMKVEAIAEREESGKASSAKKPRKLNSKRREEGGNDKGESHRERDRDRGESQRGDRGESQRERGNVDR